MPQFRRGNMWTAYATADLFLITTNSTIRQDGALVMGRGIARQARDRFPGLDRALGREIARTCGHLGEYGLLVSPRWPAAKLGAFQVKACAERSRSTHYAQPARLPVIDTSVQALVQWCEAHPLALVCLNFPGIDNGQLARANVLPLISRLPDRVWVWECD